jgi:hypothetical protein
MNDSKKLMMLNIIKIVLAVIGLILVALTIKEFSGIADIKDMTLDQKDAVIAKPILAGMTMFVLAVILLGAILIVAFFIFSVALDPKKALKSVAGYLLAGLAFLVFYFAVKGTMTPVAIEKGIETSTVKATEAGIYLTIAMVFVGFFLMLFGGLFKYIKK